MFDPCFGCMPLQQGVKICGIIKIVLEALALLLCIVSALQIFAVSGAFALAVYAYGPFIYIGLLMVGLIILSLGAMIFLDIILLRAAASRNLKRCKLWLIINVVVTVIQILFAGVVTYTALYAASTATGPGFFTIYMLVVVWAFCEELKREQLGRPAVGVMQPAPVYGQSARSQTSQRQPPPSYRSSNTSARNNP